MGVVRFLAKLLIVTGWFYLLVELATVNLWVCLVVFLLVSVDGWLWLRDSHCESPWWFEWFPLCNGFYLWWMRRKPRKERRS